MMFWLILKEKTRYPRHISGESREIISKLLAKNPDRSVLYSSTFVLHFLLMLRRLGSVGDAEEVMEQPFFAAIDWNDLKRKRITPPFRPEVTYIPDLSYLILSQRAEIITILLYSFDPEQE